MTQSMVQYVGKRTKILASAFLTRQPGIFVETVEFPHIDLLVQLGPSAADSKQAVRILGVVLGGTAQELRTEEQATRFANTKWRHRPDHKVSYFMPIVNLLFSMEDDQGYYAWSCQPELALGHSHSAKLNIPDKLSCKKIDANPSTRSLMWLIGGMKPWPLLFTRRNRPAEFTRR